MLFKNFRHDPTPYVFAVFAVVGGFLEVFTFYLHGGVFCNAQTGNVVMLIIEIIEGNFKSGLRYIYSIIAYICGIIISTVVPRRFKNINWALVVSALEAVVLVALAFIPESASDWYTYVTVAFICSVQYNTFTNMHGVAIATTFCTNNIRQTVIHFVNGVSQKSREEYKKSAVYLFIVVCFAAGAAIGLLSAKVMGNWCILICAALVAAMLVLFIVDSVASVRKKRLSSLADMQKAEEEKAGN